MDRSKKSRLKLSRIGFVSALIGAAIGLAPALSLASSPVRLPTLHLAQDSDDSAPDEDAVSTAQVDKYIAVYSAMQKNHGMTVDQAAPKQGLTVEEFRALEDKIGRNPVIHERVLNALKASATGTKGSSSTAAQSK